MDNNIVYNGWFYRWVEEDGRYVREAKVAYCEPFHSGPREESES